VGVKSCPENFIGIRGLLWLVHHLVIVRVVRCILDILFMIDQNNCHELTSLHEGMRTPDDERALAPGALCDPNGFHHGPYPGATQASLPSPTGDTV